MASRGRAEVRAQSHHSSWAGSPCLDPTVVPTFEDRPLTDAPDAVDGAGQGQIWNELCQQVPRIPGTQGGEDEERCLQGACGQTRQDTLGASPPDPLLLGLPWMASLHLCQQDALRGITPGGGGLVRARGHSVGPQERVPRTGCESGPGRGSLFAAVLSLRASSKAQVKDSSGGPDRGLRTEAALPS